MTAELATPEGKVLAKMFDRILKDLWINLAAPIDDVP